MGLATLIFTITVLAIVIFAAYAFERRLGALDQKISRLQERISYSISLLENISTTVGAPLFVPPEEVIPKSGNSEASEEEIVF